MNHVVKRMSQHWRVFRARDGGMPCNHDHIQKKFDRIGCKTQPYRVDKKLFEKYLESAPYGEKYQVQCSTAFRQKALEHFVSLQFCSQLTAASCVIDIAAAGSPFAEITHYFYKCNMFSNDLKFEKGVHRIHDWYHRIGSNANNLPVEDDYFDLMALHCSYEMFEGNDDIALLKEAQRVLKPGGVLVILPLYMNEIHHILRDPNIERQSAPAVDRGARLVYRRNFFNVRFARYYSVTAFQKRVVKNLNHLRLQIYRIVNLDELGQNLYLNWVAVFTKPKGEANGAG